MVKHILAVATCKPIFPWLSAVTCTMADFLAVDTLDFDFVGVLSRFFGTCTGSVPKLW